MKKTEKNHSKRTSLLIPITSLTQSTLNPRTVFVDKTLEELAASIEHQGILQPLLVRPDADGYEVICGNRRLKAAWIANLEELPCECQDLTDHQVREIQITENLQREDINAMDEADAFATLVKDFDMTAYAIAEQIGKSPDYVRTRLKLADLIKPAQELVRAQILPITAAAIIASILTKPVQKKALESCIEYIGKKEDIPRFTGRHDLDWFIRNNVTMSLAGADFEPADSFLVKAAGSCGMCPKKSTNIMGLFDEVTATESCLDGACFRKKTTTHLKQFRKKMEKETGEEFKFTSRRGFWSADELKKGLGGEKETLSNLRILEGKELKDPTMLKYAKNVIFCGDDSIRQEGVNRLTHGLAIDYTKWHKLQGASTGNMSAKEIKDLAMDKLNTSMAARTEKSFREMAVEKFVENDFRIRLPGGVLRLLFPDLVAHNQSKKFFVTLKEEFDVKDVMYHEWGGGGGYKYVKKDIDEAIKDTGGWVNPGSIYRATESLDINQLFKLFKILLAKKFVEDDMFPELLEAVGLGKAIIATWRSKAKGQHIEWFTKKKAGLNKKPIKAADKHDQPPTGDPKGSTGAKQRKTKKTPEKAGE